MIESHLHGGNQPLTKDPSQLKYGVSITDACIDWKNTEALLTELHETLSATLKARRARRVDAAAG